MKTSRRHHRGTIEARKFRENVSDLDASTRLLMAKVEDLVHVVAHLEEVVLALYKYLDYALALHCASTPLYFIDKLNAKKRRLRKHGLRDLLGLVNEAISMGRNLHERCLDVEAKAVLRWGREDAGIGPGPIVVGYHWVKTS